MTRTFLLFLVFCMVVGTALITASIGFESALERRTIYKYIASALETQTGTASTITWKLPRRQLVRDLTKADKTEIGAALAEAWGVLAVAQDSGDSEIVYNSFSGVAYDRAVQSITDAELHGGRMVVLNQSLEPTLFHLDGSVFQAVLTMDLARYLPKDEHSLEHFSVARETGIVSLMKGSTGWTVFSYERRSAQQIKTRKMPWNGKLVGVNYFPSATPWREFWRDFDPHLIAADFEKIETLNANAVRVFLTREDFLGDDHEAGLENLAQLLRIASDRGLQVVPTLFDLKHDFGLGTWAADAIYLSKVLEVLKESDAVAFVDLKNEPDLDFSSNGQPKMLAWLRTMLIMTRKAAPQLPVTIGWSNASSALLLVEELDVVTYHDYAPIRDSAENHAILKLVSGGKPILVTEIGETAYEMALGFPSDELRQSERLGDRLDAHLSSDGVFVWSLLDFDTTDPEAIGRSPWAKRLQANFGLLRTDGSVKPAFKTVSTAFRTFLN